MPSPLLHTSAITPRSSSPPPRVSMTTPPESEPPLRRLPVRPGRPHLPGRWQLHLPRALTQPLPRGWPGNLPARGPTPERGRDAFQSGTWGRAARRGAKEVPLRPPSEGGRARPPKPLRRPRAPSPKPKRLRGAEEQEQRARRNLSVFTNNDALRRREMQGTTLTLKGLLRSGSANGLLSKSDISLALGVTHRTQAQRGRRGKAAAPLRAHVAAAAAEQIRVQLAGPPSWPSHWACPVRRLQAGGAAPFAYPFLWIWIPRSGLWLRRNRDSGRRKARAKTGYVGPWIFGPDWDCTSHFDQQRT